jgi:hypothetical protein
MLRSFSGCRRRPARRPYLPTLCVLEDRALPSTITVLNDADSGAGSLRAALAAASSGDTIAFASSLAHTTIALTTGELQLTKSLTIQGPGHDALTISGNGRDRVFDAVAGTSTISGLTITGGSIFNNPVFNSSTSLHSGGGGAVFNEATLALVDCTLTDNSENIIGAAGGAVENEGNLDLRGCLIRNNGINSEDQMTVGGGGICNLAKGTMTIESSTISQNSSAGFGQGGGIENFGQMTITGSTISGNETAADGGGIANRGTLSITSSELDGNMATGRGGALWNSATLTLQQTTLGAAQGNTANRGGGGIYNDVAGVLTVTSSVITGNHAASGPAPAPPLAPGTPGLPAAAMGPVASGGGGIDNAGQLFLHTTTLSANLADGNGGGLYNAAKAQATVDHGSNIASNHALGSGGGAWNSGLLSLRDSSVRGNTAAMDGAGLANDSGAVLTVDHVGFVSNRSSGAGGAIANRGGLVATRSTFVSNRAGGAGGGVWTDSPVTAAISGSTFRSNHASTGGGLYDAPGSALVSINSTSLRRNSAVLGGGIFNQGSLSLRADIVADNSASKRGGGLYNARAALVTLHADLIAGNLAPAGKDIFTLGVIRHR